MWTQLYLFPNSGSVQCSVLGPRSDRDPHAISPGLTLWPPFPACPWSLCQLLGLNQLCPISPERCCPQAMPLAPERGHTFSLFPTLSISFPVCLSSNLREVICPLSAPSARARVWLPRSVKGCWLNEGRNM